MSISQKPRAIFLGTPDFAVPSLRAVVASGLVEMCAVVTQPDKPVGRGGHLTPPPVKVAALELGLTVVQPESLKKIVLTEENGGRRLQVENERDGGLVELLNNIASIDIGLTAAYGKIIPDALLEFPRLGMLNVHPSLLPRWRGAAPLHWAVFSGDESTGVAIMGVESELDSGPIFALKELPIGATENLGELRKRAALLGADLLVEALPGILDGTLAGKRQTSDRLTYAKKWDQEDLTIDWREPAAVTVRRVRASSPEPGARTEFEGVQIKVYSVHEIKDRSLPVSEPGTIVEVNKKEIIVAASEGSYLSLDVLQFPGKKRLTARDLLLGRKISAGQRFA